MRFIISLLMVLSTLRLVEAETRLVPQDYPTIQAAIDACVHGDIVTVAPGVYDGEGNRDIDFKGKAVALNSEGGPQTCVIDCGGLYPHDPVGSQKTYHRGFYFHSGEGPNSVLQGFTIRNGYVLEQGGGILCLGSSPCINGCIIENNLGGNGGGIGCVDSNSVIKNCVIRANIAVSSGGGVSIYNQRSTSYISTTLVNNCTISGNRAAKYGGGISCRGNFELVNCTIAGNQMGEGSRGGGGAFGPAHGDKGCLRNCILWENQATIGEQIGRSTGGILGEMHLEVLYCNVQPGLNAVVDPMKLIAGNWAIKDPCFVAPSRWDPNRLPNDSSDDFWIDGDYHLKSQAGRWDTVSKTWIQDDVTSPCVDGGDPTSPIGLEPFPNGGIVNMGAYGGTAEASKSYFGKPVCETIIAGDINGDCQVDYQDLAILSRQWLSDYSD